jgi:hypothetical protein
MKGDNKPNEQQTSKRGECLGAASCYVKAISDDQWLVLSMLKRGDGVFQWGTDEPHHDNIETMNYFIDNFCPDDMNILSHDGTQCLVSICSNEPARVLDASGAGDSYSHRVEISILT